MNVVETIQQKICTYVQITLPIPDILLKTRLQSSNKQTPEAQNKPDKILLN